MTNHTQTPWEINPVRTVENTVMVTGGEGFDFGLVADVTEEADAAFIVKAVNSHDALVRALQRISADTSDLFSAEWADEALALVSDQ